MFGLKSMCSKEGPGTSTRVKSTVAMARQCGSARQHAQRCLDHSVSLHHCSQTPFASHAHTHTHTHNTYIKCVLLIRIIRKRLTKQEVIESIQDNWNPGKELNEKSEKLAFWQIHTVKVNTVSGNDWLGSWLSGFMLDTWWLHTG